MRHARPPRLPKRQKIMVACVAAAAVVGLSVAGVEATGGGWAAAAGDPTGLSASAGDQAKSADTPDRAAAQKHAAAVAAAKKKVAAEAAARKHAAAVAAAKKKKAAAVAAAKKKAAAAEAAKRAREKAAANRSTTRTAVKHTAAPVKTPPPVAPVIYPNNLDGWIRQALSVMAVHGIPGTYNGIYRNIMRESSGNPNAINLWDSNAAAGTPSKGLLQTIQPTFEPTTSTAHPGTSTTRSPTSPPHATTPGTCTGRSTT